MAYCTTCYYELSVTIYLCFLLIAFTILFAFALFKIKDLKKQLQQQNFIDKHVQFAKEYNTKVYVIDATQDNQSDTFMQSLPIVFSELEKRKEKDK